MNENTSCILISRPAEVAGLQIDTGRGFRQKITATFTKVTSTGSVGTLSGRRQHKEKMQA